MQDDAPLTTPAALTAAFARIKAGARAEPSPSRAVRHRRLDALFALVHDHREEFASAITQDFGARPARETLLLEVFPTLEALRHARRHVARWMKPRRRPVSPWFLPGSAETRPQPLGCIGVVAPWNYPLYLTAAPLASILAAGNRALLKFSETSPATAALFARLLPRYFECDELAVVGGELDLARAFTALPFDHLLFTGSAAVGRQVMAAAAAHLTPVTLELGGKSPALIAPGYPLAHAAARIVMGKCVNAGQTCIAPDYVLLPAGSEEAFLAAARREVQAAYPNFATNPDYGAIVNDRHFHRLVGALEEARAAGARVEPLIPGAQPDPATRRFPPTALLGVPENLSLMREEIFGPLLPLVSYRTLDEAVAYIAARDAPLALYLFDRDRRRADAVLDATRAGGVTVNDTLLHIAQDTLPFGGVGASGMGQLHGQAGFLTFSKEKPVFRQSRVNGMALLKPPYGRRFDALLRVLLR
ncbi:MAG: coniferyl aldehyde dehydrogenase [Betaproteobacteria bacterium]|nr:coniferyl aldehyde dehydrogenase [Betaproteobacteria bacterium]MBK8918301.1 coniferyl aldehyde dehydrogenase [Betaproteobacteria bacterium]